MPLFTAAEVRDQAASLRADTAKLRMDFPLMFKSLDTPGLRALARQTAMLDAYADLLEKQEQAAMPSGVPD